MDKVKILRLCNDIKYIVNELAAMCEIIDLHTHSVLTDKIGAISAEISTPPKSNGDRIRAMTDEDLADWITEGHDLCDLCQFSTYRPEFTCKKGVLEWLKQEVSEDAEM